MEKKIGEPLSQTPHALWIEDETTARVATRCRRVLAPRGSRPVIRTRVGDYDQRINVFISLPREGPVVVTLTQGLDATVTKRHLRAVRRANGPGRIQLLWDGAGNHRDEEVLARCKKWGIHPLYFPPHAPELNPVEEINRQLKDFLANHLFWSIEELEQVIIQFFEERDYCFALQIEHYIGVPDRQAHVA